MTLMELIPEVKQLPSNEKLKLIRILAEELETHEESFPFDTNTVYKIETPYDCYGAAKILEDFIAESNKQAGSETK